MPLTATIAGIGVLGPGLMDWPQAAQVLRGEQTYQSAPTDLPAPALLPAAERRRAVRIIRLALAVGAQAVAQAAADASTLTTVFTSSGGDGDNCHEICMTLAGEDRQISPTRFHNSVHNAAAGYWSIAYGCTAPSTSLCAFDASFGAGLLEALSQLASGAPAVLLLAYDEDYPLPLRAVRPIPDPFGVALLLRSDDEGSDGAMARLQVAFGGKPPTLLADAALETLRRSIPAARGLPLLESIARRRSGPITLDYLGEQRLELEVSF
jgi:hypothetical protein